LKGGSGALRHLITFQVKTDTKSSSGAAGETWTDSFEDYAAFEPIGSREFRVDQKRHSETTARFRLRYRSGIDVDRHRIAFAFDPNSSPLITSIWNIHGVLPADGKFAEILVEVSEIKYP